MTNKEHLLNNLFEAIERRQEAELKEVISRTDLDKAIANGNKAQILVETAKRIDAATECAIAEREVDEAYKAYIKSICTDTGAANG